MKALAATAFAILLNLSPANAEFTQEELRTEMRAALCIDCSSGGGPFARVVERHEPLG